MKLRADHVAGAAFILFGLGIFAMSGDLPTGQLSMPGSGFLPKIIAGFTILFGALLALRASEGPTFSELGWDDGKHAVLVTIITGIAIALYEHLGFFFTMLLMMVTLLLVIERRNPVRAGIYCLAIVAFTYVSFVYGLKTPLPEFSF
ncbi:MAG TPA: tripartite tricarboxylate transporter TctB family protein [Pseudolabrys sp.]